MDLIGVGAHSVLGPEREAGEGRVAISSPAPVTLLKLKCEPTLK